MGSIIQSFATRFASYDGKQPITVFGTEGTMRVPDPNGFDGIVHIRKKDDADWTEMKPLFVTGYGRSVGLADMAYAVRSGRAHRASAEQAFAVLDLMQGFLDSSTEGRAVKPVQEYVRPAAMPAHLPFGTLDE
jgi:predicted dehydrogenase